MILKRNIKRWSLIINVDKNGKTPKVLKISGVQEPANLNTYSKLI